MSFIIKCLILFFTYIVGGSTAILLYAIILAGKEDEK